MSPENFKRLEASATRAAKLMSFHATITNLINRLDEKIPSEQSRRQQLTKFQKILVLKATDTLIGSQEDFQL